MGVMKGYRCDTCREMFHSVSAFDRHRTGKFATGPGRGARRCMIRAEMGTAGLVCDERGYWKSGQRLDVERFHRQSA